MTLSQQAINQIIRQEVLAGDLSDQDLAQFCELANAAYRDGNPIITDQDYDFVYLPALKQRLPEHSLFQVVEPEGQGFSEEKVLLPEVMLSTDKAYSWHEIQKWIERLEKSATDINLSTQSIQIKATPKLDGFAGFDDGARLYTRGDGKKGSDISRVFARGLQVYNDSGRGQGAGEIVIKQSYFQTHLTDSFEYPRNFQASLIKEKALDKKAQQAINDKAALFVPFVQLPTWQGEIGELIEQFETIVAEVLAMVDFDVDGVVFEATNEALKTQMGANRKFHRWQIAFKENKDKAQVKVLSVTPQVGRTGKITPVAELEPTLLSGATIVRATGHHYGLVKEQGLGAGSVIELTRSGLVIPKINQVLQSAPVDIPAICPSCTAPLQWEADFLMCVNHALCPAQVIGKMEYFFKILANNDGFGIATIEKLYEHGIRKISQIYQLDHSALVAMGFGDKTSKNLMHQLRRSHTEQIEDWRFLAAFGMARMGTGNCENLLKAYALKEVFDLSLAEISAIDGFADLSAKMIVVGLQAIRAEFDVLQHYQFNLEITRLDTDIAQSSHALFGKKIVFTGKMIGSREVMKKQAKTLGMQVLSSVTGKTNYLIIGENVGPKKIENAQKFGVEIVKELDYMAMIAQ
ncbi:BRCT domain-containing protein [Candidatus Thioglobus autotrophicus]|uniref:BRCT domain-containing protein n=1 Tax=Candidatus Thioglobus autotrophicus TaxID=1705394 RepID=UPI00299CDF13|nr:BRCT domain-containing protein [Candidatus Thioglobus autotrophicus]WPE16804.1 helix-hairpin-helix domain-containing protein [Candidatus Thioglobus autotrophicus]WPE18356.1 helix-hairpin-helix domain-containing protein [Candidatus Thioglobus autotrophicus]